MPKFPIVGMQFRPTEGIPAPTIMSLLPPGSPLYLKRDPGNEYDANAIQVWIKNVAEVIPESLGDIEDACVDRNGEAYDCPDLTQPLMLGFIKAKTISDDVQGADVLAPRIDAMLAEGTLENEADIPCELVYGESGSRSRRTKQRPEIQSPRRMKNTPRTIRRTPHSSTGISTRTRTRTRISKSRS
jgi:hypothetical protein